MFDQSLNLKKIVLNKNDLSILSEISGNKVYTKIPSDLPKAEIENLFDVGLGNSLEYLRRQSLGQELSIFEELNLNESLIELKNKLFLKKLPETIECYDISHIAGTYVYGSMVVFYQGKSLKKAYKLFKTKWQNNDFENHKEVLRRRLRRYLDWEKDNRHELFIKSKYGTNLEILSQSEKDEYKSLLLEGKFDLKNPWEISDLIIVDGGKGQLSSDYSVLLELQNQNPWAVKLLSVEMISLAKKEEEIFYIKQGKVFSDSVIFNGNTKFLLQRIRDEAHRFAIKNNRVARQKTASKSKLEDIPGIGKITAKKALIEFGSIENLVNHLTENPQLVQERLGLKTSEILKKHFLI